MVDDGLPDEEGLPFNAKVLAQHPHMDPMTIDELMPEGERTKAQRRMQSRTRSINGCMGPTQVLYGTNPGATTEQWDRFKQMLVDRKGTFAYSMKDLVGYKGPPAEIRVTPGVRAYTKPRQYSQLEKEIMDQKYKELMDAGFIIERDSRCDFVSAPVMPMKRDPTW